MLCSWTPDRAITQILKSWLRESSSDEQRTAHATATLSAGSVNLDRTMNYLVQGPNV